MTYEERENQVDTDIPDKQWESKRLELYPTFNGDNTLELLNLIKKNFPTKNNVICYAGHDYICLDMTEAEFESLDDTTQTLMLLCGLLYSDDYEFFTFV